MTDHNNNINVLHIGFSDSFKSGSSVSMIRIHNQLRAKNIKSKVMVVKKYSNNINISQFNFYNRVINFIKRSIMLILKKIENVNNLNIHRSYNFFDNSYLLNIINNSKYNVIHFHWINGEMISINDIVKINKPIVWTLHDAWIINPSAHVVIINKKIKSISNSLDKFFYKKKKYLLKKKFFSFITPSTELYKLCNKEIKNSKIYYIPHKVSRSFKRIKVNKKNNNFRTNKRNILFFSYPESDSFVKGNDLFKKILLQLSKEKDEYNIIICGNKNNLFKSSDNLKISYVGYLSEIKLNKLYNSVDLLVSCSRFESFSQTVFEAKKCNLPTISFKVGGMIDAANNKNIKLIKCYNYKEMSKEITMFFHLKKKFKTKKKNFEVKKIVKSNYISIYNDILNNTYNNEK